MAAATKLNPVQNHLLTLFNKGMYEQELTDIKVLLVQYYQEKIEQELAIFWQKQQHTTAIFKAATKDLHLRSKTEE